MALPSSARCVVIGGGVGGASIAFHLARMGWEDVVVLERHDLADGTTWHSAGFVGVLRSTISQTRMIMYSTELYAQLEQITGQDPGWHPVGGIRVATTPERVEELQRQAMSATTYGLELGLMDAAETRERLPLLAVDDVLAAAWLPADGYLDPEALTRALVAGARDAGAVFHTHTEVTGLPTARGRVTGVETSRGTIACDTVVVAAGAASRAVGALAEAVIPVVPMRHQYVITEPLGEPVEGMPTVRDPDRITYFRPHVDGGLLVGGYARDPVTWDVHGPLTEPRTLFDSDPERFDESWRGAQDRVPALRGTQVVKTVNGPEAFTPDGEFVLGETEVGGLWTAAGFCVHGLAGAGGVGKVMAEWIAGGEPEWDMSSMDIRRFGAHAAGRAYARVRALDAYSRYYDVVYPGEEREAGRPLRVSPAYERLGALGAAWGEKAGWERVNWFAANAARGDESLRPRGWAGRNWSPAIGAECLATRDRAALFDQSSFAKLDVSGPRSGRGAGAPVRERRGRGAGPRGLHPAAEPLGRDRGRPDRHARGRAGLPGGHGHRLRPPRRELDRAPPAGRRRDHHPRRDRRALLLLPLGPGGARHPRAAGRRRPLLPVPARARADGGGRARLRPADHLRR